MNSISSIVAHWVFIFVIFAIFFLLRNHLFNKYKIFDYFFIFSAVSTFGAGCFTLGKAAENFSDNISICSYKSEPLWCFSGHYFSILGEVILIVFGLIYLFGVIENLATNEVKKDKE